MMVGIRLAVLAILALVAPIARSNQITLTNNIPVNTTMNEGTTFVLAWEWDGDASGVGELDLLFFTLDDSATSQSSVLEDKLNLTIGRYPWVVTYPKGPRNIDWYCSLGITYNGGFESDSGRSFQVRPSALPSSTTSKRPTSTSTSTSSTRSPTKTPDGSSQSKSKSTGLSGGAIAGIVVGSLAGVGIFAALLGLVVYYRRKSQREEKKTTTEATPDARSSSEKKDGGDAQYLKPELDAAGSERVYYELDGAPPVQEVDAQGNPTELDSTTRTELDSNARSELSGDTTDGPRERRGASG
ncbi:hypothetical protein F5Y07DRAFT_175446 [Xylaria sp. FL0933]|nr:hypothetical protein F5Y07DRAFT_175446 [Xylaria sp. FL0933]